MEIRTVLTPAEIATLPGRVLDGVWCVVFDVLRATSTIVAALANGARRVVPVRTEEEARALRRSDEAALLGGERGGLRLEGFDLGNSPREYHPEIVRGREIVLTTTNGTVALQAVAGAGAVLAAGLVNLDATAAFLLARRPAPSHLLLVCAGTGGDFAMEDGLAAGALATRLSPTGHCMDDATAAMSALYERQRVDLRRALASSMNGRRLHEIGLGEDVAWCARESVIDLVAVMRDGALESV